MTNIQTEPLVDKKVLLEVTNLKKHFEVPDGL